MSYYYKGTQAFGTTAHFTQTWSTYSGNGVNKYCSQKLYEMKDILPGYILEDKYIQAVLGNDIYGVYNYWKSEAEEAEKAGRHVEAYLYWYKAGWDEHTYDHMENILEGLVRNAQKAGYDALYQIGLYHQRSLS